MTKLFKRVCLFMAAAMIAMALAACGDTATSVPVATTAPAAATTAPAAATTAPAAATTAPAMAATTAPAATSGSSAGGAMTAPTGLKGKITVWEAYGSGGSAEGDAFQKALAQLKKDSPDLQVTDLDVPFDQLFTKFETEAAAGGGPDLFIAPNDSLGKEARAGLLMDLTDKLNGKLGDDVQVAVDGAKVAGKMYAVPESLKAVAMFYNKDKVKTPPATTDALMTAVKGGTKFGFGEDPYHNFGLSGAFGGQLFDATGKCIADQGGFSDLVKYLQDLKTAGAQAFSDGGKLDDAFQTGALDATIEGPWKTGDFKKAMGDKLGVAPIPAGPKGAANPLTGVDGYYINAASKNSDLAVQFALYMTSPTIEQIFVDQAGHIPANKTVKVTDPITQGFAQAVASGLPRPQNAELDNFWGNFGDAYTKAFESNGDAKQIITDATAATNKANKK